MTARPTISSAAENGAAALLDGLSRHPEDGFAVLRVIAGAAPGADPDLVYEVVNDTLAEASGGVCAPGIRLSLQPGEPTRWLLDKARAVLGTGLPWNGTHRLDAPGLRRHGRWYGVHLLPAGTDHVVCHLHDVTSSRRLQETLAHRATHDTLTGLPNVALFLEHLNAALGRQRREPHSLAVVFCDLDDFKRVNDGYGHAVGDELLVTAAARLSAAVRPGDVVARFGGDEFVLLLNDLPDDAGATAQLVAHRALESVSGVYDLEPRTGDQPGATPDPVEVVMRASFGVSLTGSAHRSSEDLMAQADTALHEAKRLGRGMVHLFNDDLHLRVSERLSIEAQLRNALRRDELRLHYQPKLDLLSGEVAGLEALVRWQHPTRGLLLPGQFLPVAEENELIVEIGTWVLREACAAAGRWGRLTAERPHVQVNLAARQLIDPGLLDVVLGAIAETDLDPRLLELEVTETQMMSDLDHAAAALGRLRETGVRVALDDFGTGYSSLSWLQRFPVDTVKLDRSFVHRISHDTQEAKIVRAVVDLGHALGLVVIAEGIETEAEKQLLTDMGADLGQGFHLARPMPEAQLAAYLGGRSPGRFPALP